MSVRPGRLPQSVADAFVTQLAQNNRSGKYQAEYVWIGGSTEDLRSKSRTLPLPIPQNAEDLPEWNYDGSSTGQAPGEDSEVIIKPRRIFPDPFRGGNNILVMCDTYTPQGDPLPTNHRYIANKIFQQALDEKPWFGLEQEYTMFEADGRTPFGWPEGGFPAPQGQYYCSVGANNSFGRPIVEAHYSACLYAGITISGINAEVMPGQWEFQVGPAEGIKAGDELFMARYLLLRIAEIFGVVISFDPKPISGDWNGAGMHTNFSTAAMRAEGGYKVILAAIERLSHKHKEHIAVYGKGNERRLTGRHETASIHKFSYGVANRGASIRIPRAAEKDGKGYFEDRRPASNACPYLVTSKVFETTCLSVTTGAPARSRVLGDVPRLIYFDSAGRAEPARLAFFIGGVEFDDHRVDDEGMKRIKGSLPLGQLPVLQIGGETIAQSMAILRYAGKLSGLYPNNQVDALRADSAIDTATEITNLLVGLYTKTGSEKEAELKRVKETELPKLLNRFELLLRQAGSGYILKSGLSIADLNLYVVSKFLQSMVPIDPKTHPLCNAHFEALNNHPKIAQWNALHNNK
eukprot:c45818_g1_i1.p1 GENE.c45818_g1_i1~~c45818_g1_i1.p1  ORF type:complete len:592 (+),score=115.55 c45818_g1_i1:49-1776(+)